MGENNAVDFEIAKNFVYSCTGRRIRLDDVTLNKGNIHIYDIAHALSNNIRWNGITQKRFTVAQHSLLVAQIARYLADDLPKEFLDAVHLLGLIHDFAEAYLGDVATPLKRTLGNYMEIEDKMEELIISECGLDVTGLDLNYMKELVNKADKLSMLIESKCIVNGDIDFNTKTDSLMKEHFSGMNPVRKYKSYIIEENPHVVKAKLIEQTYKIMKRNNCNMRMFKGINKAIFESCGGLHVISPTVINGEETYGTDYLLFFGEDDTTIIKNRSKESAVIPNKILNNLSNLETAFLIK